MLLYEYMVIVLVAQDMKVFLKRLKNRPCYKADKTYKDVTKNSANANS